MGGPALIRATLVLCREGWQLTEIEEERPRRGVLGMWRCVLNSLLRRRPVIRYEGPFPRYFDAVVLVSPIWAGRLAGPMRSFVARRRGHLPDIAMISVANSDGGADAVAEVTDLVGEPPILSAAITAREIQDGTCVARLRSFRAAVDSAERSYTAEATVSSRSRSVHNDLVVQD
jgi:hypothetical protein